MITLKVNGLYYEIDADPDTPLLYVLRDEIKLNAAKFGCGLDVVAQDIEQRRIRVGIDLMVETIDLQSHHGLSRCVASAGALCGPADV